MRRAVLLLSALLVAGSVLPTEAAPPKAQVTDPAGDAVGTPGMDVVSAVYQTTGTGTGKKYVPKKLVVTLSTAGPVEANPGVSFKLSAMTSTCGQVDFIYFPGTPYSALVQVNAWAQWGDCLSKNANPEGNAELITASVRGNSIIWSFSIKGTPLKLGTIFKDFRVYVDPCDPVLCFPFGVDQGLIDAATGSGSWKLG